MAEFPREVTINKEGPREGFQFEKGPIPTARKIELVDALSKTRLTVGDRCSRLKARVTIRAGRGGGNCGGRQFASPLRANGGMTLANQLHEWKFRGRTPARSAAAERCMRN